MLFKNTKNIDHICIYGEQILGVAFFTFDLPPKYVDLALVLDKYV